eukprot:UN26674
MNDDLYNHLACFFEIHDAYSMSILSKDMKQKNDKTMLRFKNLLNELQIEVEGDYMGDSEFFKGVFTKDALRKFAI